MRIAIAALCVGTTFGLFATSNASAQGPAGPKRFSSQYGGAAGGMGMGGMGMGGMGMGGATPRKRTPPKPMSRPAAAPNRYSPSGGGAASGGISLPPGGGRGAARRQLRRNNTPVVSPYLNLDPSFAASDTGQFFNRVLPQQEYNRTQQQTQQALSGLQSEIGEQETEIRSGLSTTGHKTTFMNYGSYFPQ